MNGLPSLLRTDNVQDLLFSASYDTLFNVNEATTLFVFDDLSIFELCIHNPDRILRASPSCVRDRFFVTIGAFQDLGIRLPSITEKQVRFTITVPFDRLDKLLGLFLGPFPMMHRMNQPAARQDVDKRPSIAHVLSLSLVVTEPGFFLRYTTKIHQFDTGSNASLAQDRSSLPAHAWLLSGAKCPPHRVSHLLSDTPLVAPSLPIKAVRLPRQATQELLNCRRRSLSSSPRYLCRHYSTLADAGDYGSLYCLHPFSRNIDMLDCHSIVGLYTYQNRVPFAPSLQWVSCKERDRLPHQGANFHSSVAHSQDSCLLNKCRRLSMNLPPPGSPL